jgi:hypothetical protein
MDENKFETPAQYKERTGNEVHLRIPVWYIYAGDKHWRGISSYKKKMRKDYEAQKCFVVIAAAGQGKPEDDWRPA